jgi:hypothetical protein
LVSCTITSMLLWIWISAGSNSNQSFKWHSFYCFRGFPLIFDCVLQNHSNMKLYRSDFVPHVKMAPRHSA